MKDDGFREAVLTPNQRRVEEAWEKYDKAVGEDKTFRLRVALHAELAVAFEKGFAHAPVAASPSLPRRLTWEELDVQARGGKLSATAEKWAKTVQGPIEPSTLLSIATAFYAGELWAESDRCPDCHGRAHSQEECPAHEKRSPFTPGPPPNAPQCLAVTHDKVSGNTTQCRLHQGHGRHDDGCLSWEDGMPAELTVMLESAISAAQGMREAEAHYGAVTKARMHAGDAARRVSDAERAAGRLIPRLLDALQTTIEFPPTLQWATTPPEDFPLVHYTAFNGLGARTACGLDTMSLQEPCHNNIECVTCPKCRAKLREKLGG